MRKFLSLFIMSLLTTAFAVADETTVTFSDLYGSATVQPATEVSSGSLVFSFAKGDAGTEPAYVVNASNKEMRLYGGSAAETPNGNTMTVSCSVPITKIVLTHGSSCTWANVTANAGEVAMAENHDLTWTGSATSVTFTVLRGEKSTQYRFTQATITTSGSGEIVVSKPTFSPAAGTYYSPVNVTLSCATADASIYYTLDGSTPTTGSTLYSAPIALSTNTTVKAIAALNGKVSDVVEAAYEFGTATQVANIAAYKATADETVVAFANPVNVLAHNGSSLYVKDDSGYAYFYGSNLGQTYKNGDVIPAGFIGTKTTYRFEPELKVDAKSGFQAASSNTPIDPEVIQASDVDASLFAHYVLIKGATLYIKSNKLTDASGEVMARSGMGGWSTSTDTTKVWDVYAIVGNYLINKDDTEPVYCLFPVKVVDPNAGTQPEGVENIAAYAALADNKVEAIAGDVTVYYVNGQNTFVKDDSGYLCIYGNTGQTYQNGDVIPGGFKGTKTTYNEGPEMKTPLSGFQAAKANNPVSPEAGTTSMVTLANWGHYLKFTDVKLTGISGRNFNLVDANGTVVGYNQFYATVTLPSDETITYDVVGIVSGHSGAPQFAPTEITIHGGGEIEIPEVDNINALLTTIGKGSNATITGAMTAIYQNGQNLYVKDEAGTYGLVFGNTGQTYENGDIIRGAVASWTTYGAITEIVPGELDTWVSEEKGTPVEPEEIALEEISQQDVHKYFLVKNATITKNEKDNEYTIVDESETPTILFNKFNQTITIPEELEGKTFDVKVFATLYKPTDSETAIIELYPVELKDNSAPEFKLGDVNMDGEVGIADITSLVNIILNNDNPSVADYPMADVNQDGEVGIADVTALVSIVLEQ